MPANTVIVMMSSRRARAVHIAADDHAQADRDRNAGVERPELQRLQLFAQRKRLCSRQPCQKRDHHRDDCR